VLTDGYRDALEDGTRLEAESSRLAVEAYAPVLEALLAVQVATGREWDMTGGGDGPGGCLMKGGGGSRGGRCWAGSTPSRTSRRSGR